MNLPLMFSTRSRERKVLYVWNRKCVSVYQHRPPFNGHENSEKRQEVNRLFLHNRERKPGAAISFEFKFLLSFSKPNRETNDRWINSDRLRILGGVFRRAKDLASLLSVAIAKERLGSVCWNDGIKKAATIYKSKWFPSAFSSLEIEVISSRVVRYG